MLEDVLRSIGEAEKQAEVAMIEATENARNAIKACEDKAQKDIDDAIVKCKEWFKTEKANAIKNAEKEAKKRMDKGCAEAEALKKSKKDEITALSQEIVEKVIKTYVND